MFDFFHWSSEFVSTHNDMNFAILIKRWNGTVVVPAFLAVICHLAWWFKCSVALICLRCLYRWLWSLLRWLLNSVTSVTVSLLLRYKSRSWESIWRAVIFCTVKSVYFYYCWCRSVCDALPLVKFWSLIVDEFSFQLFYKIYSHCLTRNW